MKEIRSTVGRTHVWAFCRQEQWSLVAFFSLLPFLFSVSVFLPFAAKVLCCSPYFCFHQKGQNNRIVTFPVVTEGQHLVFQGKVAHPRWEMHLLTGIPRICGTLQMHLCQQSHHERWGREEAGTQWGLSLRGGRRGSQDGWGHRGQQGRSVWVLTITLFLLLPGESNITHLVVVSSPCHQHVSTLPSFLHRSSSLSFNLQRSLNKKATTSNRKALPSPWKQLNFLTEFQSNPFTCGISHNYWQHWKEKPCPCCSRMSKGP